MHDKTKPEQDDHGKCPSPGCAQTAARDAVKEVFAILGVNIDNPHEVEEFRKSLRFGDQMRRIADKGAITIVITALGVLVVAVLAKFGIAGGH